LSRITTSFTGILVVLALALPAAASAQFLDPVLDQYAPSTQQVDKKLKDKDGGGGQGSDDASEAGVVAQDGQGVAGDDGQQGNDEDSESDGDKGNAGGGAAGGGGGDGDAAGGGVSGGGADAGTSSGADEGGLDARLLSDVPVTWFDFLAFALATAALVGTALVLRRLSRSPRVEG
jgi:hypothetical protein